MHSWPVGSGSADGLKKAFSVCHGGASMLLEDTGNTLVKPLIA